MNILSKGAPTNVDIQAMATSDPIALLDGVIRELEVTRAAAMRASAIATDLEKTELTTALADLESKLAMAHQKRDEVRARLARTARIRELSAEMIALRDRSDAATAAGDDAGVAAVKARIEEIRVEAQALAAKAS